MRPHRRVARSAILNAIIKAGEPHARSPLRQGDRTDVSNHDRVSGRRERWFEEDLVLPDTSDWTPVSVEDMLLEDLVQVNMEGRPFTSSSTEPTQRQLAYFCLLLQKCARRCGKTLQVVGRSPCRGKVLDPNRRRVVHLVCLARECVIPVPGVVSCRGGVRRQYCLSEIRITSFVWLDDTRASDAGYIPA